ncbi:uncharacterized protein N7511_002065 [Penicillium nucicola]|uniref:uncharacterized protein n=1 Tax=Penicillium nucicola TaxID=1850975 RepID=UPI00254534C5|nr:uncharacterized protein N7511_002065 [Penicillium nucicola]KAJ5770014.1 hypothetical protein N7511_002065 [Penicillium nucicola]
MVRAVPQIGTRFVKDQTVAVQSADTAVQHLNTAAQETASLVLAKRLSPRQMVLVVQAGVKQHAQIHALAHAARSMVSVAVRPIIAVQGIVTPETATVPTEY